MFAALRADRARLAENSPHGEPWRTLSALVLDATGIGASTELRELWSFFHPRIRRLEPSGRLIVIGAEPGESATPAAATAQRALEGFVRAAGKEVRHGSTAQLVRVAAGAEGLLGSSLRNLQRADTGFDPSGLLTARVSLAVGRYPDQPVRREFWHALEERIEGLPGVLAVGISNGRPPSEAYDYNNYDHEQQPTAPGDAQPVANWVSADEGLLGALGMPLLEGRWITRDDETADGSPVIVVARMSRRLS